MCAYLSWHIGHNDPLMKHIVYVNNWISQMSLILSYSHISYKLIMNKLNHWLISFCGMIRSTYSFPCHIWCLLILRSLHSLSKYCSFSRIYFMCYITKYTNLPFDRDFLEWPTTSCLRIYGYKLDVSRFTNVLNLFLRHNSIR